MSSRVRSSFSKRLGAVGLVLAVAIVASLGLFTGVAKAATLQATAISYTAEEKALVSAINSYRASAGLPALKVSDALSGAARKHSQDMAKYAFYYSISFRSDFFPVGSSPQARMALSGYNYNTPTQENIGNGFMNASEVLDGWKAIPAHKANMLNPAYKVIGVGIASGGIYRYYYTADFGGYVDSTAHSLASAPTAISPVLTAQPVAVTTSVTSVAPTPGQNPATTASTAGSASTVAAADDRWGKMPLYFVPNQGQADSRVAFYVQGSDKTLYFTPGGTTFTLGGASGAGASGSERQDASSAAETWVVKFNYLGANPVTPVGKTKTDAVVSYFNGRPEQWNAGLPTYSSIVYRQLWTGVDLTCSGTASQLKQEYVVQPGADPGDIQLAYSGATVVLNDKGQLNISTPAGSFTDDAPIAYQDVNGTRVPVDVAFSPQKSTSGEYRYGFRVGAYDHTLPLVIDPAVIVYCGIIGSTGYEFGEGIAVDAAGFAYITGETSSRANLPMVTGPDRTWGGGLDAFVAKVKPDGTGLVYLGYIGGDGYDCGNGIAVDSKGCAYITGRTSSSQSTLPVLIGPDTTYNNSNDAFVAKVKADGTGLVYCGYIGGNKVDTGNAIALDAAGCAYVTGFTYGNYSYSTTLFPTTRGADTTQNGDSDAFVSKVKADGTGLAYSSYIGGAGFDFGTGIAVDAAGCAYVTGETVSTQSTFPMVGGLDPTANGGCDAFVVKMTADGGRVAYSGYLGGSGNDYGLGIAVDGAGCAYVAGFTRSDAASFPVRGSLDPAYNGNGDAFVAKVQADGSALVYSGYIGGSDFDYGAGIAVDAAGYAYVTGYTRSNQATFPVLAGPDLTYNGGVDGFVAKVRSDGSGLVYSGYVGGSSNGTWTGMTGNDYSLGIAVDKSGFVYVTGQTGSSGTSFPSIGGLEAYRGRRVDEVFLAKIGSGPRVASVSPNMGLTTGGNVITITGSNFTGATSVKIGGVAAGAFSVVSDTKITATVPGHSAGLGDVIVATPNGTSSGSGSANDYSYCTRAEESNSLFYYTVAWTPGKYASASGGYLRSRGSAGTVKVKFTGTGFRVICRVGPAYGKLKVTIDGVTQTTYPDLYSATYAYQKAVYSKTGLSKATHLVTLSYSGKKNTSAAGMTVNIDAVDVCGTLVKAP